MVQSKVITVSFSEAAKMKSVFVAAFCTILAVSLFKECKSARGNSEASSSNQAAHYDYNTKIELHLGLERIKCLVSLLKFQDDGNDTLMYNGALIGNRAVLPVSICAHEIATSYNLNRYRVQVAEGLNELYVNRCKHIVCVDLDIRHMYAYNSQLAWIVLQEPADVAILKNTIVTVNGPPHNFQIHHEYDHEKIIHNQVETAHYPIEPTEITEGVIIGLDKFTHRLIKDFHEGITSSGGFFFHVPSKFTSEQIKENPKRIMGFLLYSEGLLQGIGMTSVLKKDGSRTDIYARVDSDLIDNIPKAHRRARGII